MKKLILVTMGLFLVSAPLYAAYEEYHIQSDSENSFQVMGRGLTNVVGMPAEISSSFVREYEMHSRLWPVTYGPRMIGNIFCRFTSALNDVFMLPWYAPLTDDTSPWSDGIGLPRYPWQVHR